MRDLNREQVAFGLFRLMNESNKSAMLQYHDVSWADMWAYYNNHGWTRGYLALADHIVSRGYKP